MPSRIKMAGAGLAIGLTLWAFGGLVATARAGDEAFEKEVRPLLIGHCVKCHGPEKQRGGLRLDDREAMIEGGDTGPAIVPGRPDESLLLDAVRQAGDLKMPPERKLRDDQIAALEGWIREGAIWPNSAASPRASKAESWLRHWAFQPVSNPTPPTTPDDNWCRNPIDRFILRRLSEAGLRPSPRADRRTLIRRLSYDLTGLPPSPKEVDAFMSDTDPDAYPRLVERLLASPHYGEQWGRHWLDVARYSDTKGYVYAREERFFVHAPAYRDWVVRAFNDDMPYDRFLVQQIAADREGPDDRSDLAAMGFLTLGRRFLGVTHDIIDDRIDVVTRGTMGLTVACARCHDHKYDPIPTADYYSLYGVFRNSTERLVPAGGLAASDAGFAEELAKRQEALAEKLASGRTEASKKARARLVEYLMAQRELEKYPQEGFDQILSGDDLIPAFVRRWEAHLAVATPADDPVFRPWKRFAALKDADFPGRAEAVSASLHDEGTPPLNRLVGAAFAHPPASMREVAERYGQVFADVDRRWKDLLAAASQRGEVPPSAFPDPDDENLRRVLYGPGAPCEVPDEGIVSTESFFDTGTCEALWRLQGEVDRLLIQSPSAPPFAVALVDREGPQEPRIFHRGNPASKGDVVPRRFLSAVGGRDREPFPPGSGRLELARAIVDPKNPLTARVWANRLWQHHFGAGLVRTPSDFGMRAEPPSHPELLDWLACRLVDEGWSTKSLHRLIVNSATYQQGSSGPEDPSSRESAESLDPENRLLWRMNARRLTFEEMRDTLLAVSGELDLSLGGRSTELFPAGATNRRRTLYGLVDRQFLPGVLRVFDFANPDLHIPQRSATMVPQQALFSMNHPFVADSARALAARLPEPQDDASTRIRALYRAIYQRDPTESQARDAGAFLAGAAEEPTSADPAETLAWSYGYGSIDTSSGRVAEFRLLPHFTGSAWQGGPRWPDDALGWVQVTASGGHPGNDPQHASIRRWTAPRDGAVEVRSSATHEPESGDGIRCRIVSSRLGVLKDETLHHETKSLDVEAIDVKVGDTLDFVTDIRDNLDSDQFLWAPEIRERAGGDVGLSWQAARDFRGPRPTPLDPWEQLAHVLLQANELMFVD